MSRKRRERSQETGRWIDNPWVRIAITVLIVVHLAALFAAPFHMAATREGAPSPSADMIYQALFPYIQAARLNHGYQFFAPDPGPTRLFDYEIEFDDGRKPISGRFPNLDEQWPRLFYHRHMMLSERLAGEIPPPPANMASRVGRESLPPMRDLDMIPPNERTRADAIAWDFANHLLDRFDGKRITLTVVTHQIPLRQDFIEGESLDDERLFVDIVQFLKVRQ